MTKGEAVGDLSSFSSALGDVGRVGFAGQRIVVAGSLPFAAPSKTILFLRSRVFVGSYTRTASSWYTRVRTRGPGCRVR